MFLCVAFKTVHFIICMAKVFYICWRPCEILLMHLNFKKLFYDFHFLRLCVNVQWNSYIQERVYQNFMLSNLLTIFSLLGSSVKVQSYFTRGLQNQFLAELVCVVVNRILLLTTSWSWVTKIHIWDIGFSRVL